MVKCSKCKSNQYITMGYTCEPNITENKVYANFKVICNNCGHIYIINRVYELIKETYWCELGE